MRENLRLYVDEQLRGVERTQSVLELKEELTGNMQERYDDLIADGLTPKEAFEHTIDSMGDIRPLFVEASREKKERRRSETMEAKEQRGPAEPNREREFQKERQDQGEWQQTEIEPPKEMPPRKKNYIPFLLAGCICFLAVSCTAVGAIGFARQNVWSADSSRESGGWEEEKAGPGVGADARAESKTGVGAESGAGVNSDDGSYTDGLTHIDRELSLGDAQNINIHYAASDIDVEFIDGNTVYLKETYKTSREDALITTFTNQNGTLLIEVHPYDSSRNKFFFGMASWGDEAEERKRRPQTAVIQIPGSFHGTLNMDIVSGETDITGFSGEALTMDAVSGDVYVADVDAPVEVNAVSGDIWMERIADDVTINVVSGEITLKEISGGIEVDGISGNIRIEELLLPAFSFDVSYGGGKLRTNFDDFLERKTGKAKGVVGAGKETQKAVRKNLPKIRIDTMSGSIVCETAASEE